jgi:hypothetical protein
VCSIQIFLFHYRYCDVCEHSLYHVSNVSLDKDLYILFQISLTVTFISQLAHTQISAQGTLLLPRIQEV